MAYSTKVVRGMAKALRNKGTKKLTRGMLRMAGTAGRASNKMPRNVVATMVASHGRRGMKMGSYAKLSREEAKYMGRRELAVVRAKSANKGLRGFSGSAIERATARRLAPVRGRTSARSIRGTRRGRR